MWTAHIECTKRASAKCLIFNEYACVRGVRTRPGADSVRTDGGLLNNCRAGHGGEALPGFHEYQDWFAQWLAEPATAPEL
jgi:hypothetical protein